MQRPVVLMGASAALLALLLAARSVAAPVALASAPTILIALLGRNPFPPGAIALSVFAWTALAIVVAIARDEDALPARAALAVPVVFSFALLTLMALRLGASGAPDYGSVKLRLFLAQNVTLLAAGILIARKRRQLNLFIGLTLVVSTVTALVLIKGLITGHGLATLGGRFSLYEDESPIGLAREASAGLIVSVSVVLSSRSTLLRPLALVGGPLIAVAFFATGSRGPVLGLVAGFVVLLALTLRDPAVRRRLLVLSLAVPAAAVLVTRLVPNADLERSLSFLLFGNSSQAASNGRYELWHQAYAAFHAHPLLGVGTGGFATIVPVERYPHNLFLETGAELGFLGVVFAAVVVGGGIVWLARATTGTLGEARGHAALVCALFAAALVNALVSADVAGNNGLWLAIGLGIGLAIRRRRPGATGVS
jgi:O-antigen ligase